MFAVIFSVSSLPQDKGSALANVPGLISELVLSEISEEPSGEHFFIALQISFLVPNVALHASQSKPNNRINDHLV